MWKIATTLLVIWTTIFMVHHTQACSCIEGSLSYTNNVCKADYAIQGTITERAGNASLMENIEYTVDVVDVLTAKDGNVSTGDTILISTASHTCGFPDLSLDVTYLLAGGKNGNSYVLRKCNAVAIQYDADMTTLDHPLVKEVSCSARSVFFDVVVISTALCSFISITMMNVRMS